MSNHPQFTFPGWALPADVENIKKELGDAAELAKKADDREPITDRPPPMETCECACKLSYYGIHVSCKVCNPEEHGLSTTTQG